MSTRRRPQKRQGISCRSSMIKLDRKGMMSLDSNVCSLSSDRKAMRKLSMKVRKRKRKSKMRKLVRCHSSPKKLAGGHHNPLSSRVNFTDFKVMSSI